MTVKELRKALEGVDDDVEVTIFLPDKCKLGVDDDYMHKVAYAKYCPPSSIGNKEFEITAGKGFGY